MPQPVDDSETWAMTCEPSSTSYPLILFWGPRKEKGKNVIINMFFWIWEMFPFPTPKTPKKAEDPSFRMTGLKLIWFFNIVHGSYVFRNVSFNYITHYVSCLLQSESLHMLLGFYCACLCMFVWGKPYIILRFVSEIKWKINAHYSFVSDFFFCSTLDLHFFCSMLTSQ